MTPPTVVEAKLDSTHAAISEEALEPPFDCPIPLPPRK